jgi:hypothetical protein
MSNEVYTMCFSNNIFQDYGVRVMGFNATFNNISVTGSIGVVMASVLATSVVDRGFEP